jgi:hypothetical protein
MSACSSRAVFPVAVSEPINGTTIVPSCDTRALSCLLLLGSSSS